ncbi:MAG: hypothetical protein D6677_04230 [Calditrichaeota bacterium]|nr:MAG: hypothetical protein D6677_04230 [Calditrichota bacterium]
MYFRINDLTTPKRKAATVEISLKNMYKALEGLALGNAFGNLFYKASARKGITRRALPDGPWPWTADTSMAVSVCQILEDHKSIDEDSLAAFFVRAFQDDTFRGYGNGMFQILNLLSQGQDWRYISPGFANGGSYGNEAAVRAVCVGAYFAGHINQLRKEAEKSAIITHFHKEARCGALATALAAHAIITQPGITPEALLKTVIENIPDSLLKQRLEQAQNLSPDDLPLAIMVLGNGDKAAALDTVPLALWITAHYLKDFEEALWTVATAQGDADTIGAIVGGLCALATETLPPQWLNRREALPLHLPT